MVDQTKSSELAQSTDMAPVEGAIDVAVPAASLWTLFAQAHLWPTWNRCFQWVHNTTLNAGQQLIWSFQPIKRWYPYRMPAVANIIELVPGRRVTWEVTALPGFYAHHTYSIDEIGDGRARFRSWEKAFGPSFRLARSFWLAHFEFVKDSSLDGAHYLEELYRRDGSFDTISPAWRRTWQDRALTAATVAAPVWFYAAYVRPEVHAPAPGVHAVLGGGGNSVIVENGGEALLIDSKFPPASGRLARWIERYIPSPVTKLVNTHFHYDHTQGNVLYPKAEIIAHERVPQFMIGEDDDWWSRHQSGLPSVAVGKAGLTVRVGQREVQLFHPGPAHTHGDLVAYLPAGNIVVTGDLFFHTYYPFFDPSSAGASIDGLIRAIRQIVARFPNATVVPGHGPMATIADLARYGDYLEALRGLVEGAIRQGWSEDRAVAELDLSAWKRKVLPSYHGRRLSWATRDSNVRAVYRLTLRERGQAIAPENSKPAARAEA